VNGRTLWFVEGGVRQRVVEVRRYDHARRRILVVAEPNRVPRWINLGKPRTESP
jgi:hypothetical protein